MQPLSSVPSIRAHLPHYQQAGRDGPSRKSLLAPIDRGQFVKPLKRSFYCNPRLSPMTRVMLTMLAGWAGDGRPIETTLGIIARHVERSARQVQRYLKDALEEGYLRVAYTKDRIGRITGLCIHLNRLALLHSHPDQRRRDRRKPAENLATTDTSDTKEKNLNNREEAGSREQIDLDWQQLFERVSPFELARQAIAMADDRDRLRPPISRG